MYRVQPLTVYEHGILLDIGKPTYVQMRCNDQKAWQIKKRKMGKLIQNKKQTCPVKTDSVINLSDRPLTEDETFVLALGFNFQPRFPDLPIADIMAATEDLIEKIDTEVGQQLRVGVYNILHKV